eukprot:Polyplicarium_translucidae@DN1320_c0_g1_i2.p1
MKYCFVKTEPIDEVIENGGATEPTVTAVGVTVVGELTEEVKEESSCCDDVKTERSDTQMLPCSIRGRCGPVKEVVTVAPANLSVKMEEFAEKPSEQIDEFEATLCSNEGGEEDGLHLEPLVSDDERVKCNKLGMTANPSRTKTAYTAKASVRRQMVAAHSEDAGLTCDACGKMFVRKESLQAHRRTHSEPKLKCDICEKLFRVKTALQEHMNVHSKEKRFKCQVCDNAFRSKSGLSNHLRIHNAVKRHACGKCDATFAAKSDLTRHDRIHTGSKQYKCDECGKMFARCDGVRKHLWTHKKNSPHKCDRCRRTFNQRNRLVDHYKKCSIERGVPSASKPMPRDKETMNRENKTSYKNDVAVCDTCGKTFKTTAYLRKHMAVHQKATAQTTAP